MRDHLTRRHFLSLTGAGAATLALGATPVAAAPWTPPSAATTGWTPLVQQPPLDPQMQAVIDALMSLQAPKITDLTPFNARQTAPVVNAVQTVLTAQGKPPLEPVANINHRLIPGGAGQQLLVRIYQPAGPGPFPALVYFHGGGFVIANLDVYDSSCRAITNAAQCTVVSVAYRQAPEYRFPAAPEDAFAAYRWVLDNAAAIRVDPARVAVGGESAGGNLATVTALLARDRGVRLPLHQLLVYPLVDYNLERPSYQQYATAMPLSTPLVQWFLGYYLRGPADGANPLASPIRADLRGMPPATIIAAEVDPLLSEGEAYAARLREAGIATSYTLYRGVTHEFFGMPAIVDQAKQAVAEAAAALNQAFGTA